MNDLTPTRSAVLELQEERRAMREGYQFLDEKRLLLAAEMLAELRRYEALARAFRARLASAAARRSRLRSRATASTACRSIRRRGSRVCG